MLALAAGGLILLLLVLLIAGTVNRQPEQLAEDADPESLARAAAELHDIQRRIDVSQFQTVIRNEALTNRRELRRELDRLDNQ